MWFKKKASISGYNPNTAVDGSDLRTNGRMGSWSISQTLPSAAEAGNYFYLPASGFYSYGTLNYDYNGYYWSSSSFSWNNTLAYALIFTRSGIKVSYQSRLYGYRVGGFQ